jgi:hypothetical protein
MKGFYEWKLMKVIVMGVEQLKGESDKKRNG